ncbi:MAG: GNAT family N-acetyltransferase [Rubrobacter sp.]
MVGLVDLSEETFREYRVVLARDYARDKVRAGAWSADGAEPRAARELDGLLPEGPDTEGHFLYAVCDESIRADVGNLWLAVLDSSVGRTVWIYDIVIHEQFRRQGYGALSLGLVEEKARELGAESVGLHVFGHNEAARALYERTGYETTDIVISKRLDVVDG